MFDPDAPLPSRPARSLADALTHDKVRCTRCRGLFARLELNDGRCRPCIEQWQRGGHPVIAAPARESGQAARARLAALADELRGQRTDKRALRALQDRIAAGEILPIHLRDFVKRAEADSFTNLPVTEDQE